MSVQRFPKGWDDQLLKQLLTELDARTEDEWIASDDATTSDDGEHTVITVPTSLLPEIRRMLAAAKKT